MVPGRADEMFAGDLECYVDLRNVYGFIHHSNMRVVWFLSALVTQLPTIKFEALVLNSGLKF